MERKQYEQVGDIHYERPRVGANSPVGSFLLGVCALGLVVFFVVGAITAWKTLEAWASVITPVAFLILCIAALASLVGFAVYKYKMHSIEVAREQEALQAERDARERVKKTSETHLRIAERTISFDERGNAALVVNGQVTQVTGNYSAYPLLTSLHQSYRNEADKGDRLLSGGESSPLNALPLPIQTFHELLVSGTIQQAISQGKMLLGYENGQLRYGSWLDLYSAGIGGVSGGGKTTTVRFLLFQAVLAHGKLIMIDPHINEPEESLAAQFKVFKNIHVLPPCSDDPSAVVKRVRWLDKEYKRRKARGIKGPPIIFVLDEFNAIVRNLPDELRKELAELLKAIAQEGRKFGLFAMLIGQRWSEQDLGGKNCGAVIRSSLASTLAHRFTDEEQAKKLIGSKHGPKCLELEQGHYYFRDTHGHLTEMITPYTVMEDGAYIQRLLDGENTPENTIEAVENTPQSDFSDLPSAETEPLHIADFTRENTPSPSIQPTENTEIRVLARQVILLQADGKQKPDIMRQVWNVNPGATDEYKKAVQEYQNVMRFIAEKLGEEAV